MTVLIHHTEEDESESSVEEVTVEDSQKALFAEHCLIDAPEWRKQLLVLFETTDTRSATIVTSWIFFLIIFSSVSFCVETLPQYYSPSKERSWTVWRVIEYVCIFNFSLEYLLRFLATGNRSYFVTRKLNILDLVCIAPFYLDLVIAENVDVRVLRIVRLARIFRVFKLGRYSVGLRVFAETMRDSLDAMVILFCFMFIGVILYSSGMYFCERGEWDDQVGVWKRYNPVNDAWEDSPFMSIPHSFWWCMTTMTTVGYGDVYPVTFLGKCLASLCMLTGVLIIALPTSVMGTTFMSQWRRRLLNGRRNNRNKLSKSHSFRRIRARRRRKILAQGAPVGVGVGLGVFPGSTAPSVSGAAATVSQTASVQIPGASPTAWGNAAGSKLTRRPRPSKSKSCAALMACPAEAPLVSVANDNGVERPAESVINQLIPRDPGRETHGDTQVQVLRDSRVLRLEAQLQEAMAAAKIANARVSSLRQQLVDAAAVAHRGQPNGESGLLSGADHGSESDTPGGRNHTRSPKSSCRKQRSGLSRLARTGSADASSSPSSPTSARTKQHTHRVVDDPSQPLPDQTSATTAPSENGEASSPQCDSPRRRFLQPDPGTDSDEHERRPPRQISVSPGLDRLSSVISDASASKSSLSPTHPPSKNDTSGSVTDIQRSQVLDPHTPRGDVDSACPEDLRVVAGGRSTNVEVHGDDPRTPSADLSEVAFEL